MKIFWRHCCVSGAAWAAQTAEELLNDGKNTEKRDDFGMGTTEM